MALESQSIDFIGLAVGAGRQSGRIGQGGNRAEVWDVRGWVESGVVRISVHLPTFDLPNTLLRTWYGRTRTSILYPKGLLSICSLSIIAGSVQSSPSAPSATAADRALVLRPCPGVYRK